MQDFRKLQVWEKAHRLTLDVYKATGAFPKEEVYGLTSQMRRTAISVPSNIAEGRHRAGDREFARFLYIALGSAAELEYHLLLAHDLGFLLDADYARLSSDVEEVKRMLSGLIQRTSDG